MNTKEKLELLWKYLFLLVVAIGVIRLTNGHHSAKIHFGHEGDHEMLFIGDDKVFFGADDHKMDVKVEQEIVDEDTIMKVWINGEEVDASSFSKKEGKLKWVSEDGEVIVIDIDDDHHEDHKEKDVRIIKKKIIMRDEK